MTHSTPTAQAERSSLRAGRLGVIGVVFFVVAASAPLVGITGAVPVAMLVGNGAGTPGAYLVVGLTLLLFSVGYAAMSHRVTNSGAFFAYVGKGLGVNAGVASAFVSILTYVTIQLAIYGFFGGLVAGTMADGREFVGVTGLEQALLARPELLARTVTEKLLTFALGRGVEFYDAPAVRKIVRDAEKDNYRLARLIHGIVSSVPFQMRSAP